jgi:hypothetical protein
VQRYGIGAIYEVVLLLSPQQESWWAIAIAFGPHQPQYLLSVFKNLQSMGHQLLPHWQHIAHIKEQRTILVKDANLIHFLGLWFLQALMSMRASVS